MAYDSSLCLQCIFQVAHNLQEEMACGAIKFLLPPTAIHHAVYCNFFNKREKSLVVAGLNFVQVYRLNVTIQPEFPMGYDDLAIAEIVPAQQAGQEEVPAISKSATPPGLSIDEDDEEDLYAPTIPTPAPVQQAPPQVTRNTSEQTSLLFPPENVRLECVASYELFGTITDLKASTLANSNRDLLLLTFADAKLSCVQYDPTVNDLRSISLHDYEAAKYSDEMPTNLGQAEPLVRVDPDGRCAIMRLYRTQLMVVPFTQAPTRSDNALTGPKPITQFKSFALSLKPIKDDPVEFIQDFQMLSGKLQTFSFQISDPKHYSSFCSLITLTHWMVSRVRCCTPKTQTNQKIGQNICLIVFRLSGTNGGCAMP